MQTRKCHTKRIHTKKLCPLPLQWGDIIICSIISHNIHVKEKDLYLAGTLLSPFLYIGLTLAFVQSLGTSPAADYLPNISKIMGSLIFKYNRLNHIRISCIVKSEI